MTAADEDRVALERAKIRHLIEDWASFRDGCQWDRLRRTYAPGATMAVSWFSGSALEFVDRCAANLVPAQHVLGGSQIDIAGNRALSDTRTVILLRVPLHGVLCDIAAVGGFRDRLLRRDGSWLLQHRVAVFEKDMVQPVIPGEIVPFDRERLMHGPAAYRFCAYLWSAQGIPVNMNLPAIGSAALAHLNTAEHSWLDEAAL